MPSAHRRRSDTVRTAPQDAVFLRQSILLFAQQQPPFVQKRDVVADLLQIADDVAGDQHGVLLVPGEVREDGQYLVPYHRVKAAGGLVQQQQLRLMAQRRRQPQLHLHAP